MNFVRAHIPDAHEPTALLLFNNALVATQHGNGTDNRTEVAVGLKQLTVIAACLELMCRVPK